MTIVTIYALFGDDIRVLATDKDGDPYFYILNIIAMSLFTIEIVIASMAKEGYFFGFFFWLDVLSTVSMLLDIGWISQGIVGGNSTASAAQLARAGRASRIGTRAGRIVKVVRLIRLVKLYKHAQQTLEKEAQKLQEFEEDEDNKTQQVFPLPTKTTEATKRRRKSLSQIQPTQQTKQGSSQVQLIEKKRRQSIPSNENMQESEKVKEKKKEEEEIPIMKETKVGQKLSDLTNRRVITIVLSILFSVPVFNLDTYRDENLSYDNGLKRLIQWKQDQDIFDKLYQDYILFHVDQRMQLVYLKIESCCEYPIENTEHYQTLRQADLQYFSLENDQSELQALAIISIQQDSELNAILSIVRTVFVSIALSTGAIIFSKDIQDFVLTPIENMVNKVQRIAENPLEAAQIEEQEGLFLEENMHDEKAMKKFKEEQSMETVVLEKLIVKIGALLALGFGEAGSEIIAENIRKSGQVDPMIAGKKIMAIFGFCDIRNFTDATEVLQEDVMVFVNEIAEIVHGTINYFSGTPNKNIGDAFLLAWKINEENTYYKDGQINAVESYYVTQIVDMSILSFVKIISAINISKKLMKYRGHPGLNERLPNYSVKMGFGLHLGWAIEGAIGSIFKIDASYLSPNVNMASRLEAATKQFGTQILISGALRKMASEKTKDELRQIDRVTVKGSTQPIDLYTIDVCVESLLESITKREDKFSGQNKNAKRMKVINRISRDQLKKSVMNGDKEMGDFWRKDKEIIAMRLPFSQSFYEKWDKGFKEYLGGEWKEAEKSLQEILEMREDGPCKTLLQVIKEEKQSEWKGYRELTEK